MDFANHFVLRERQEHRRSIKMKSKRLTIGTQKFKLIRKDEQFTYYIPTPSSQVQDRATIILFEFC